MSQNSASLIKSAVPISQYVARFSDDMKPAGGGKFKSSCIAHGGDNNTAMSIDDRVGLWFCHSAECGGGSIIDLWMKMHDSKDFGAAVEALSKELNVQLPDYDPGSRISSRRVLEAIKAVSEETQWFLHESDHDDAREARRYMRSRKIKIGVAEEWDMGMLPSGREAVEIILDACEDEQALVEAGILSRSPNGGGLWAPMNGRFHFPIKDESGVTVGFGSRIVPEVSHSSEGKFVNTRETSVYHKSKIMFGQHLITDKTKKVVVVEGYLDTVAVNAIFRDTDTVAMAVCGTSLAEGHVNILNRFDSVTYLFDGDVAGRKAAVKTLWSVNQLRDKAFVSTIGEGTDPWDLYADRDTEELKSAVTSSLPLCTVAVQSQWDLVDGNEHDMTEWVRSTVPGLSYTHHRDQMITDTAMIIGKSVSALKRDLAVPVNINSRRTASAAMTMMSEPTKSLCCILLAMDPEEREGILSTFLPWSSKVEETIKRWLPVNTDMDLMIIKKITLGAEDTGSEGRVDLAIAEMMNTVESPESAQQDMSILLRGIAKQMLAEISSMKSVGKIASTQVKLLRRSITASRDPRYQVSAFAFLMDMSMDIERQNRIRAKEVA